MGKYKITVIKIMNETLAKEWKKLWNRAENANVFNSYEWFLASIKTCKITEYEIYACFRDDDLVVILPLFFTRRFGIKVASAIGYKFVNTPFLIEKYDKELLEYFFENIISKQNLYISKIDSKSVEMLHEIFPKMFFSLTSVNPYINRRDNHDRFIFDTSHARVRKIIKEHGNQLHFVMYDNQTDLMRYLKIMFDIEQKSSKKLKNMDLFSKKENREYFINIVKYCSSFVQIAFIYYNDIPIAYDFSLKFKDVILGYQCAYLSEFGKISPGIVMTIYELESFRNTSFNIFDLGGGISSYKQGFTLNYYFLYDLWFSKNILTMFWWKLINLARRIKQILFPIKHTRDHEFLFKTLK